MFLENCSYKKECKVIVITCLCSCTKSMSVSLVCWTAERGESVQFFVNIFFVKYIKMKKKKNKEKQEKKEYPQNIRCSQYRKIYHKPKRLPLV